MFDLIIKGGKVVDGAGNSWFYADVGVKDGKIAAIANLADAQAGRVLDAKGMVVCPGFIDIHAHGLNQLILAPTAEAKIRQGITTMLGGNCGHSAAPITQAALEQSAAILRLESKPDWSTLDEFFAKLETSGTSINLAALVGNGTIRTCVMGTSDREPSGDELEQMKRLTAQAMEQGAMGLSTGLVYQPSGYAKTQEVIELCKVVASYGGFYATHLRGMGNPLFRATAEALEIGRQAGLPVQVSHLFVGPNMPGRIAELVGMLEQARAEGMDVTGDTFVYRFSEFGGGNLLPLWASAGGTDAMLKRLQDPKIRQEIKAEIIEQGDSKGGSVAVCLMQKGDWDKFWYYEPEHLREKTFAEVAAMRGATDPFEALFDVLLEQKGAIRGFSEPMRQEDVDYTVNHPLCMLVTDGFPSFGGLFMVLHTYGSFGKVFGEYVRDRKVVRLEEAVRKCTSFPAQRLGLKDRGLLKKGFWADITIFNPETVREMGSFKNPKVHPEGFQWVLVNGEVVLDKGRHTGALPGRVLRRT